MSSSRTWPCTWKNPVTGRACPAIFSRRWNLQRHMTKRHSQPHAPAQTCQFIPWSPHPSEPPSFAPPPSPSGAVRRIALLLPEHTTLADIAADPRYQHGQLECALEARSDLASAPSHDHITPSATGAGTQGLESNDFVSADVSRAREPSPGAADAGGQRGSPGGSNVCDAGEPPRSPSSSTTSKPHAEGSASPAKRRCVDGAALPCSEAHPSPSERTQDPATGESSSGTSSDSASNGSRKRKYINRMQRPIAPPYQVSRSMRTKSQQKGLAWLTAEGKERFDTHLASILKGWGVGPAHKATCVLLPVGWAALDPMTWLDIFTYSKTPLATTSSPQYRYEDHQTNLTRAIAWFDPEAWEIQPRRGLDLDNFLENTHWQPIQGSHTCHDDLCIVHVVLDPVTVNEGSRKDCHERARFLRGQQRPVPERCENDACGPAKCYLRLAALTRFERCCRQYNLLRRARGQPVVRFPRPHRHRYSTFEEDGDLKFCQGESPSAAPAEVLVEPATPRSRPDLICPFCDRIESYANIVNFWSHIYHLHPEQDETRRLDVVRQTAEIWAQYFHGRTHRGPKDPTMVKLAQARAPAFDWAALEAWRLRR